MRKEVKEFFDDTNKYLHKDFGVTFRREIISSLMGERAGLSIIDIGCGNGAISAHLLSNNNVTFVDFSSGMLELLRKSLANEQLENSIIIESDLFSLKETDKYDIVLLIGVLAHVNAPLEKVLDKLKKFLKKDSTLFVQFTDSDHWISRLDMKIRKTKYAINRFSAGTFEKALHKSGFEVLSQVAHATPLPGMGKFSNDFLLKYVRFITKFSPGRTLKPDLIYMVRKAN